MKMKNIIKIILVIVLLLAVGFILKFCFKTQVSSNSSEVSKDSYHCPMHPNFTTENSGSCSICGMTLVKKKQEVRSAVKKAKKLLYYRNPMNPEVTSPVPMKDSMGMDYIAVYDEELGQAGAGVYISPEKQQLIGVKQEKVQKRNLTYQILTVGKVAYDPNLYIAQEEYLQALKTANAAKSSVLASVSQHSDSLLEASKKKLLLLGMTKEQIEELAREAKAQENLYLTADAKTVWVYLTIYEYELDLVKIGLPVEIDLVAFPGEVFVGKIVSINPVLNAETRSAEAKAIIANTGYKLKSEMFVNAKINVDLGEKLAVPEEAVLDTGLRKIVYIIKDGDLLEAREIKTGQKALGFYEVLDGLKEGDTVVTSGNFLVDSESKLKGASR